MTARAWGVKGKTFFLSLAVIIGKQQKKVLIDLWLLCCVSPLDCRSLLSIIVDIEGGIIFGWLVGGLWGKILQIDSFERVFQQKQVEWHNWRFFHSMEIETVDAIFTSDLLMAQFCYSQSWLSRCARLSVNNWFQKNKKKLSRNSKEEKFWSRRMQQRNQFRCIRNNAAQHFFCLD